MPSPPRRDRAARPAPEDMSYEQSVEELETIIERIESGEIGLEESIHQYERASLLLRRCREILGQAEQRIERLDAAALADGSPGGGDDEEGAGDSADEA